MTYYFIMTPYTFIYLFTVFIISVYGSELSVSPPHCTVVSKDTDYQARYHFNYPVTYLKPGQREAYQQMYCLNPARVNKAVTTVCDWNAPPQVEFTMGDEYVHVVRQDPSRRYRGNVVITTYQLCGHNRSHVDDMTETNDVALSPVLVTELE